MISGMLNICLQLIEALIVFYFYEGIRKNRSENKLRLFFIVSSYVIMCVSNLMFNYNTFLNFLILLIFQYVIAKILYEFSAKSSAFYSSLITLLVFVTELVSITFTSVVFNTNSKEYTKDPYQYLLMILLSKSLLFIVLKIISDIIKNSRDNTKVDYAFYIYPFSLIFVLFDFAIVFYSTELDGNLKIFISLTSLLFTVSIIIFCIFQQHTAEKEQELMELRTIREKQKIEEAYFELLEHQNDELQIFVHDIQKHLENIGKLSDNSEEIKEYVSSLSSDLSNNNKIGKTPNKLLDLIIDKYDYLSKKQGITFEKNIHTSKFDFISQTDLTSIFNNLLDNAVESAIKSKDKLITLSINSFGNILFLELTNSCDFPPHCNNDKLLTAKKDGGLHGYGFKSITKSVKKYNGDIEWEYKEDEKLFCTTIFFPMKDE